VMLLFAFPFGASWLMSRNRRTAFVAASGFLGSLLWALTFQNMRYYAHLLPMICVTGAACCFHFLSGSWMRSIGRILLACVLALHIPGTVAQFWNISERFPLRRAFGLESEEAFLNRALGSSPALPF
jgi:hypothetical protein